MFGDAMLTVAAALAIGRIHGATGVGLALAAWMVPYLGLILFGGVLADRFSARPRVHLDVLFCAPVRVGIDRVKRPLEGRQVRQTPTRGCSPHGGATVVVASAGRSPSGGQARCWTTMNALSGISPYAALGSLRNEGIRE